MVDSTSLAFQKKSKKVFRRVFSGDSRRIQVRVPRGFAGFLLDFRSVSWGVSKTVQVLQESLRGFQSVSRALKGISGVARVFQKRTITFQGAFSSISEHFNGF